MTRQASELYRLNFSTWRILRANKTLLLTAAIDSRWVNSFKIRLDNKKNKDGLFYGLVGPPSLTVTGSGVLGGGDTRVYGVYQPPGFLQRILTSAIINKQGTFRPFATPLFVYPPPF